MDMEKCKVVHHKKEDYDVLIDRTTKWGCPFSYREGTRATYILPTIKEAIEAYRECITNGEGKYLLNDLHELKVKTLGCWCKPKTCHGDVLVELVNNLDKSRTGFTI